MHTHPNQILTISQYAKRRAKKLTAKITLWGTLCLTAIVLGGSGLYHYTEIKQGMKSVGEGLSQTVALGGDFIPKHIMKGAISTGNFKGLWIYDNQGNLMAQRVSQPLDPSGVESIKMSIQSSQLISLCKSSLTLHDEKIGTLVAAYHIPILPIVVLLFIVGLTIIFISYLLNHSLYGLATDLTRPIIEMTWAVRSDKGKITESNKKWDLLEIDKLYETFKSYLKKSEEAEMAKRSAIIDRKVASIAYKVRHDIKASLYIAENKLNKVPNELSHISTTFKSILDRICNIAEDIPKFDKLQKLQLETEEDGPHCLRSCHIGSIVNEIVNEFTTSNLEGKNIEFETQYEKDSFHSYCRVDITKIKRTLVNLIKNSIESIPSKGKINILLSNDDDFLYLSIKDNGVGMTDGQLNKVGQIGVTFKKDLGTGLGLSSSIENIQNWKGKLKIESVHKKGTTIKILLPLSEENLLLPTQVFIEPDTEVIVADDDPLYLDLYREKFSGDDFKKRGISFIFTNNTTTVEKELTRLANKNKKYFLLSDQNFREKEKYGLDIIRDFEAIEKSILISSDGTDPSFLKECEELGIPVISKSIVKDIAFMAIG